MGLRPPGSTPGLGVLWDPFPVGIPGGFAPHHWEFLAGDAGPGPHLGSPVAWGFCTGRETSNPLSWESPWLPPPQKEFKNNILKPELSSPVGEGVTEAGACPGARSHPGLGGGHPTHLTSPHPSPTPTRCRSVLARRNTE